MSDLDDSGDVELAGGIPARHYWPINHLAELLHHRRRDVHSAPALDAQGFCIRCWSDASARYMAEREEIASAGTLFEHRGPRHLEREVGG